jgi:hypothetical protein
MYRSRLGVSACVCACVFGYVCSGMCGRQVLLVWRCWQVPAATGCYDTLRMTAPRRRNVHTGNLARAHVHTYVQLASAYLLAGGSLSLSVCVFVGS